VQNARHRAAFHSTRQAGSERIERFNRTYREEVLSAYLFDSLDEVREITNDWLERYNELRPHYALGSLPPARYRERLLAAETPV
jgi:putative transposase